MEYRPLPSLWLSVRPEYETRRNDAQWVDRMDETIDGTVVPHYVYGELTAASSICRHGAASVLLPN